MYAPLRLASEPNQSGRPASSPQEDQQAAAEPKLSSPELLVQSQWCAADRTAGPTWLVICALQVQLHMPWLKNL